MITNILEHYINKIAFFELQKYLMQGCGVDRIEIGKDWLKIDTRSQNYYSSDYGSLFAKYGFDFDYRITYGVFRPTSIKLAIKEGYDYPSNMSRKAMEHIRAITGQYILQDNIMSYPLIATTHHGTLIQLEMFDALIRSVKTSLDGMANNRNYSVSNLNADTGLFQFDAIIPKQMGVRLALTPNHENRRSGNASSELSLFIALCEMSGFSFSYEYVDSTVAITGWYFESKRKESAWIKAGSNQDELKAMELRGEVVISRSGMEAHVKIQVTTDSINPKIGRVWSMLQDKRVNDTIKAMHREYLSKCILFQQTLLGEQLIKKHDESNTDEGEDTGEDSANDSDENALQRITEE